jgi:hypothetical protein
MAKRQHELRFLSPGFAKDQTVNKESYACLTGHIEGKFFKIKIHLWYSLIFLYGNEVKRNCCDKAAKVKQI